MPSHQGRFFIFVSFLGGRGGVGGGGLGRIPQHPPYIHVPLNETLVMQVLYIIIIYIPLSEVDEVVWLPRNSVLLPISNEHNPTQVHTYKNKQNGRWTKLMKAAACKWKLATLQLN